MAINNLFNNISTWFRDRSERNNLVRSFNESARKAFIAGAAPALLKSSISKGDTNYRSHFSKVYSGFRIQTMAGRPLTRDELIIISRVILSDDTLVRQLYAFGWDTLEVHSDQGQYGCKWRLSDYMNLGGLLEK